MKIEASIRGLSFGNRPKRREAQDGPEGEACSICGAKLVFKGVSASVYFYKDGQIELYHRSTLLEEEEEDSKARAREKRNDREKTGLAPSHALATSRRRSIGDIVVPVAGCNKRCNGHVVKLLGRLNRRRRNPQATSSPLSAAARQLKGKGETKARGRLRAAGTGRESETGDVGGKLQPPSCT